MPNLCEARGVRGVPDVFRKPSKESVTDFWTRPQIRPRANVFTKDQLAPRARGRSGPNGLKGFHADVFFFFSFFFWKV